MDFTSASYRDIYSGYNLNLHAVGGKFGVQYDQALAPGLYMTVGATYKTSSRLKGRVSDYKYATISSQSDTLHYNVDTLSHGSNVNGESNSTTPVPTGEIQISTRLQVLPM